MSIMQKRKDRRRVQKSVSMSTTVFIQRTNYLLASVMVLTYCARERNLLNDIDDEILGVLAIVYLLAATVMSRLRLLDFDETHGIGAFREHSQLPWGILASHALKVPEVLLMAYGSIVIIKIFNSYTMGGLVLIAPMMTLVAAVIGLELWTDASIEWDEHRSLRGALNQGRESRVVRVGFGDELIRDFWELLESDNEKAFCALTVKLNDVMVVVCRLGPMARGKHDRIDVDSIVNHARVVVDALRERWKGAQIGMVIAHSHPAVRQGLLPEQDEIITQLVDGIQIASGGPWVGDGAYIDAILGYIKTWFSREDRAAIHALTEYCEKIGILVWGINYEVSCHKQLRPGYDVHAFRAAKQDAEDCADEILPLEHFNALPRKEKEMLQSTIGVQLIRRLSDDAERLIQGAESLSKRK